MTRIITLFLLAVIILSCNRTSDKIEVIRTIDNTTNPAFRVPTVTIKNNTNETFGKVYVLVYYYDFNDKIFDTAYGIATNFPGHSQTDVMCGFAITDTLKFNSSAIKKYVGVVGKQTFDQ